jgi:hypothetical protein
VKQIPIKHPIAVANICKQYEVNACQSVSGQSHNCKQLESIVQKREKQNKANKMDSGTQFAELQDGFGNAICRVTTRPQNCRQVRRRRETKPVATKGRGCNIWGGGGGGGGGGRGGGGCGWVVVGVVGVGVVVEGE